MTNKFDYASFFDLSIDMLCIANGEGYFLRVNPKFSEVLGYTEKELLDKPFLELVHPDDLQNTLAEMELLGKGHKTINFQNRYKTKEGDYRFFNWRAAPEKDTGLIYAVATDISIEVAQQKDLRQLSAIAKQTDNSVVLTDVGGRITWVNKAFERISEYSYEEVKGKKPGEFLQGRQTDRETIQLLSKAIKDKTSIKVEILNYAKSGRTYWLNMHINALYDEQGNHEGFISIQSDVTFEKKNNEKFLEAAARIQVLIQNFSCGHF
jgi:PAS domain S-box-containing protein